VVHLVAPAAQPVLVWRFEPTLCALSSAPVGGGPAMLAWICNIGVDLDYDRTDLDRHASEVATEAALSGPGAALFTAADTTCWHRAGDGEVVADATVGLTQPTWAAGANGSFSPWSPGTINLVAQLPVGLDPAAAVNAVMTLTEAKSQALLEAGVPGTGTASDAAVVCWPAEVATERFAGPRSPWGSRLARAVHSAVAAGIAAGQ
jgi:adenosylcobinamide amidohydrolase